MADTLHRPTQLTLMAVHAHPDDESSSTGGVLARYADEGIRTVVVTCTDGEFGDTLDGVKPGEDGHEEQAVAQIRLAELRQACKYLAVTDLELLGYHDSGMEGWPQNDAPGSFWRTPVGEAAARLVGLMRSYEPHVVVTYDENGFYGHPDHIQANRVTLAAIAACGIPSKLYYTAVARSRMRDFRDMMAGAGMDVGAVEDLPDVGTPDELITTTVDVAAVAALKYASLAEHASQSDNIFFLQMGEELFSQVMGTESFVRVMDTTNAPLPEDDLFAGLR